jgi:hypothetical protein
MLYPLKRCLTHSRTNRKLTFLRTSVATSTAANTQPGKLVISVSCHPPATDLHVRLSHFALDSILYLCCTRRMVTEVHASGVVLACRVSDQFHSLKSVTQHDFLKAIASARTPIDRAKMNQEVLVYEEQ